MKKIIILTMFCLGIVSCEKWFDISPKSEIKAEDLFSTKEGFDDALTGVYSIMTTPYSYGSSLSYGYIDVMAQYYEVPATNSFTDAVNYRYINSAEESRLTAIWKTHYEGIANLNAILNYIEMKKVMLGDYYYSVKGQTLALRAYLHFDLLRLFAPSVKMGTERSAIPYMSEYTNIAQPLETVKSTLDKIITDLNTACDLMRANDKIGPNYKNDSYADEPETINAQKHQMSYYGAKALLARVCLYAGKPSDALTAAKEIIGEPNGEIVPLFKMAETSNAGNPLFNDEIIFWLDKQNMKDEISPYFSDEAAASYNNTGSKYFRMKLTVKNNMYSSATSTDIEYRKDLWFKTAGTVSAYVTLSKYNSVKLIPMLRVSELFLIAAECATTTADQLAYLNRFKSHRGLNPVSEIEKEIEKEYIKEFVGEGQLFFYYKRNNMTKIGVSKSVTVDPEKIYRIGLPLDEQDLGNRKKQ